MRIICIPNTKFNHVFTYFFAKLYCPPILLKIFDCIKSAINTKYYIWDTSSPGSKWYFLVTDFFFGGERGGLFFKNYFVFHLQAGLQLILPFCTNSNNALHNSYYQLLDMNHENQRWSVIGFKQIVTSTWAVKYLCHGQCFNNQTLHVP